MQMSSQASAAPMAAENTTGFIDAIEKIGRDYGFADGATHRHGYVVGELCSTLAVAQGVSKEEATILGHAARLHDIGKFLLPPAILHKPGPLDIGEREVIQMHSQHGQSILSMYSNPHFQLAAQLALLHHERVDGTGYPFGLREDDIPAPVKTIAICDVYEALRSSRSYKDQLTHDEVVAMLRFDEQLGTGAFDQTALTAFLDIGDTVRRAYRQATAEAEAAHAR